MSDASLDFCERCDQPTYARALHDGVCDNCNPVPFLRARIAELKYERDVFARALDKRDKHIAKLEAENERLRPVLVHQRSQTNE